MSVWIAGATRTAAALQPGAREAPKPRSVLEDADRSPHSHSHTRDDRTFAGLPVLGGDPVAHTTPDGSVKGVDNATAGPVVVASAIPVSHSHKEPRC
ncbi:hypothetical protein GCM10010441_42870 [Kitasatospora paracochleata]|uniref:FTP domain-containing protein n=1 Tax=Kitasatospora paracochleata TaxID=58354 RepID=A0ABT1J0K1_9ACTN|nr:hypothetical protein [Kitasatospora paracochleata]MCP2310927.1 hypothetical protein [Kitasatospora paracochleata]